MKKTLEQQLQILVNDAPKHGIAPIVIQKAIAPELLAIANQLAQTHYCLLQSPQQDWLISVISQVDFPKIEKKVIFAFSSLELATQKQPQAIALELPVIEILWRFFSLQQIDSLIFVEGSQPSSSSIEIDRQQLQHRLQQQLMRLKDTPFDIA